MIKLGYDAAYGARPLRRTIQNLIEDPLAEHLLLGRYRPGDTIVVDLDPDGKGLSITASEAKTPVEACQRPPQAPADGPRPEPLRLPVLRCLGAALGGPMPRLRGLEHARRDGRARRAAAARPSRRLWPAARPGAAVPP